MQQVTNRLAGPARARPHTGIAINHDRIYSVPASLDQGEFVCLVASHNGYITGYLTEFSLCFTPCISMTKWNIQLKRGSKDRYLKELSKEYNIVTLIFELS